MVLKQFRIENFTTQQEVYSKLIRGQLAFRCETKQDDNEHITHINLYRDHDKTKALIDKAEQQGYITKSVQSFATNGTLRLYFNDKFAMFPDGGEMVITITELNFNPKGFQIVDYPKGKVAIYIQIQTAEATETYKSREEIVNLFTKEEENVR